MLMQVTVTEMENLPNLTHPKNALLPTEGVVQVTGKEVAARKTQVMMEVMTAMVTAAIKVRALVMTRITDRSARTARVNASALPMF
jgi:nitrate reductase gamma subunit